MAISDPIILPRLAFDRVAQACLVSPVVVLMGARGVGKSTLVRDIPSIEPRRSFRLDDPEIRAEALGSPRAFLASMREVTLDGVQRAPELLSALARLVDNPENRQPGRFVLTSSANLLRMRQVTDTLAGQAIYTTLWPFTRRERLGFGEAGAWSDLELAPVQQWLDLLLASSAPADDWGLLAATGGYPNATRADSTSELTLWHQEYVESYVDRDLPQLSAIDNQSQFLRLMKVACRNLGRVVNKTEWGREAALPPTTVDRYLDLLEMSYQLIRVAAYDEPCRKRLITGPKAFWSDTGLALHLAGDSYTRRAHLENMVLTDLVAWRAAHSPRSQILHWRTTVGADVSFVTEFADETVMAVQVSEGAEPTRQEYASVELFLEQYRALARGAIMLHGGIDTRWMANGIVSTPWWRLM